MPRKGKRKRVARGLYLDGSGYEAVVTVGDWSKAKRFPPNEPIKAMREWQDDTRARLRHSGVTQTARGTLAADVDLYLSRVTHLVGWISLRANLRRWVELYGTRPRHSLTATDIDHARHVWLTAKVAKKTINMRVNDLRRLWHKLDGKRAITPMDDLAPLALPKRPIVVVSNATIKAVYEKLLAWERTGRLRDAKTRARFMVYASCGRRPSEIARTEPTDVDLERRVWIPRDGKGGWSPGIYLNDDMRAAWRVFVQAQAWGTFREGSFVKTLRAAGWPPGVRPYTLRHTVGIGMSEAGADLSDVQQHLGHTRIETTRKHYVPVLGTRLQRASESIDKRFGW